MQLKKKIKKTKARAKAKSRRLEAHENWIFGVGRYCKDCEWTTYE